MIIMSQKAIVPAEHAINWYLGNFIESPNNALRDDEELLDCAFQDMEKLKVELKGRRMTHKELLDLVKARGLHEQYYRYEKFENDCLICKRLGLKW